MFFVEGRMRYLTTLSLVWITLAFNPLHLQAQADGLVAYVPNAPLDRTADNIRIGFAESAVAGKMEAVLPVDAIQADILNARGNVKHTYGPDELGSLSLGDLRPGTWTLRVHTSTTMLVRRFVVMERGAVLWSPSGPIAKAGSSKKKRGSAHP